MMSFTSATQPESFGSNWGGSAHGSDEPSTGLVEAIACWVAPLKVVKYPPIRTRESSGATATVVTEPFTTGAHGSMVPAVDAEVTAPTRFLVTPSTFPKLPPT